MQSWVSGDTPVTCNTADGTIVDGRHRLWLTRDKGRADVGVPVLDDALRYFPGALEIPGLAKALAESLLEFGVRWAAKATPAQLAMNAGHLRRLAAARMRFDSEPLEPRWVPLMSVDREPILTLAQLHGEGRLNVDIIDKHLLSSWRFKTEASWLSDSSRDVVLM